MKKIIYILIAVLVISMPCFSQTSNRDVNEVDPERLGNDTAQQELANITINKFEDAAFWSAAMPSDQGFISVRRLPGFPMERETLDAERIQSETDRGFALGGYALGVKIQYNKRGMNYFYVYPIKPLAIEGITKTISVWVVGRNYNHILKIVLGDYFGNKMELTVGTLNFAGWRKMTVAVPPGISQTDFHYPDRNGLNFLGFKIECDLADTRGTYYIYFDDLSAVTDLFLETSLDQDDMADVW